VGASADVRQLIAENQALMGYIDSADADGSVKVVHQFSVLSSQFSVLSSKNPKALMPLGFFRFRVAKHTT